MRTIALPFLSLLMVAAAIPAPAFAGGPVAGARGYLVDRAPLAGEKLPPTASDATDAPRPRSWATTYTYNIYRSSAFSTQKTYVWCIAAGVQMMRNYAKGESDHSSTTQKRYYDDARAHDRFPNDRFAGSDAQGWAAAARNATGVSYIVRVHDTYRGALQIAAYRLRKTGKPVGLMVSRGGHAWIMNGFSATADPLKTSDYLVTDVFISGPLYPIQQSSSGYDRVPNKRYAYGWLQNFFLPFRSLAGENSELWHGKYLTVTP